MEKNFFQPEHGPLFHHANLKLQGNLPHCKRTEGHVHQQGKEGTTEPDDRQSLLPPTPRPHLARAWLLNPPASGGGREMKTGRKKKEEGPGQTSSQLEEVTPTQLQPVEKGKRKQHTFTHESFLPRKMWPSQGFRNLAPDCKMEQGRGLEFSLEDKSTRHGSGSWASSIPAKDSVTSLFFISQLEYQ